MSKAPLHFFACSVLPNCKKLNKNNERLHIQRLRRAFHTQVIFIPTKNVKLMLCLCPTYSPTYDMICQALFSLSGKVYMMLLPNFKGFTFQSHLPNHNVNLTFCIVTWVWKAPLTDKWVNLGP